jgi:hypothetical protein
VERKRPQADLTARSKIVRLAEATRNFVEVRGISIAGRRAAAKYRRGRRRSIAT